jgi:hypothetical protein
MKIVLLISILSVLLIYVDILFAQDTVGTTTTFFKDALKKILKRHSVSQKLYDDTVNHYMRNPAEYKEFMLEVEKSLIAIKEEKKSKIK